MNNRKMINRLLISPVIALTVFFFSSMIHAQAPVAYSSSDIRLMLKKLGVLGRVMYVAAHPDDENTNLITYFAQYGNLDVAYLSLTRGDGGQNLVGPEIGADLGVIRTGELLAARRIDGGRQFFTRAVDFGYSKTWSETLNFWDEEKLLADMVMAIRQFRPDVMITRFPPLKYNYDTHGHHSASAYLAEKAFTMAGDVNVFPEQLEQVDIWQPRRLYWNTSTWFYRRTGMTLDISGKIAIDVGSYIPVLGQSCSEIAAVSRSQHKSQGFGAEKKRGRQIEYLEYVKGEPAIEDLFENIDRSWTRVDDGERIKALVQDLHRNFDLDNPATILPKLTTLHNVLAARDDSWYRQKCGEVENIIAAVTGLFLEATTDVYSAAPESKISLRFKAINRSRADFELSGVSATISGRIFPVSLPGASSGISNAEFSNGALIDVYDQQKRTLLFNEPLILEKELVVPEGTPISQPFWLAAGMEGIGMYSINEPSLAIMPEAPMDVMAIFTLRINDVEIDYSRPLQFKWTDRVEGELYRPFIVSPRVTINPQQAVIIFQDHEPREIVCQVRAWADGISGEVSLDLPDGWSSQPTREPISLQKRGDEAAAAFRLNPGPEAIVFDLKPVVTTASGTYNRSRREIAYDHIPIHNLWPEATVRIVKFELRKRGNRIGYIMGSGDEVAENLRRIGYQVELLDRETVAAGDLMKFDAILVGIRAYNTEEWLPQQHEKLMAYVERGGALIVQYQTTGGLLTEKIGPYPFTIGRDRVTMETATMTFADPRHPLFNQPNQLTAADFDNWVQERGLYFASEWDDRYSALFSCSDPGEEPVKGSLLVTEYGDGIFIYAGISFFRQLPAGVPGAFRLLTNMISYRLSPN